MKSMSEVRAAIVVDGTKSRGGRLCQRSLDPPFHSPRAEQIRSELSDNSKGSREFFYSRAELLLCNEHEDSFAQGSSTSVRWHVGHATEIHRRLDTSQRRLYSHDHGRPSPSVRQSVSCEHRRLIALLIRMNVVQLAL